MLTVKLLHFLSIVQMRQTVLNSAISQNTLEFECDYQQFLDNLNE